MLNETQQQVLDQASQFLGEHFDHALIVVNAEVLRPGYPQYGHTCTMVYHGSNIAARGLADFASTELRKAQQNPAAEDATEE